MRTSTKVYLGLLAVLGVALLVFMAWPSKHKLVSDPQNIEKIVGLDLPDFTCNESSDNLDRGSSRWDCYEHNVGFKEKLSKECIEEMEHRCANDSEHWSKNAEEGYYRYSEEGNDLYSLSCHIYNDHAYFSCMIDEDESLIFFLFWFLAFMLINGYGFVLLVIALIRKYISKKKA
jgi:hypothetical protein